jgi:hypothetical protein
VTAPRRQKRSLLNTGGPVAPWGDPAIAARLAECLDVDPEAKPPFTHGFHAYPARMHPHTAERAIRRFAAPGARVLDPFVGSGTVAVEAVRAGLAFTGVDISAVALEIAWARTRFLRADEARLVAREGAEIAEEASGARASDLREPEWGRDVASWFSPHTYREIGALAERIEAVDRRWLRRLLRVALSSILVRLSKQASDSVTAVDRDWRPWPPRTAYRMFAERCAEVSRSLAFLSKDLRERGIPFVEPEFLLADSRAVSLPKAAFGLGLSSPPYPGTYDYSFHHFLRYPLFGEDASFASEHEIGARREFKKGGGALDRFVADLTRCVGRALDALTPGAPLLLLIGDGRFGTRTVHAEELLRGVASRLGATIAAGASQERTEWSFGGRSRKKHEHFLLIRRG